MTPTSTVTEPETTLRDRAADARQYAKQVADDVRRLKTHATDAVQDGLYAARRSAKRARLRAEDARDDLAHRIKKQPFGAVAVATGVGAVLGMVLVWSLRRHRTEAD